MLSKIASNFIRTSSFSRKFCTIPTIHSFQGTHIRLAIKLRIDEINDEFIKNINTYHQTWTNHGIFNYFLYIDKAQKSEPKMDAEILEKITAVYKAIPTFGVAGIQIEGSVQNYSEGFINSPDFLLPLKLAKSFSVDPRFLAIPTLVLTQAFEPNEIIDPNKIVRNVGYLQTTLREVFKANIILELEELSNKMKGDLTNTTNWLKKIKHLGFDLNLGQSFIDKVKPGKRENSAEFLKFIYNFDEQLRYFDLSDFVAKEEPEAKLKFEDTSLGSGIFDLELFFNMLKASSFKGLLTFNSCQLQNNVESFAYIQNILKKDKFSLKTLKETDEYDEFKKGENLFSKVTEIVI